MISQKLFKSPLDQAHYIQHGFVKKQLLDKTQVDAILKELLLLKPDDGYSPQRAGASNYHCTFLDTNEAYKRATNELFKSVFNPIVQNHFVDYHVWNGNFYVKPPGAGKFEIHQNWTHVKEERFTSFTMWCPLVDTTIVNGTIALVKGSHKILPDIATLDVPYYFNNFESSLIDKYLEPISCKAGEAVIFEDGVIHFSDINKSDAPRYALQILIGPTYTKPVYYYFDKANPDKGFEVFEINEDFFMKTNYLNFKNRPQHQHSIGFVPNHNQLITEAEFTQALSNGEQRRRQVYGIEPA